MTLFRADDDGSGVFRWPHGSRSSSRHGLHHSGGKWAFERPQHHREHLYYCALYFLATFEPERVPTYAELMETMTLDPVTLNKYLVMLSCDDSA